VTHFIFEAINWSPYLGIASPDLPRIVRAAARAGFDCISLETSMLDSFTRDGSSLGALRRLIEGEGLSVPAVHSIAIGEDAAAAREAARPLAEAAHALGAHFVHVGGTAPPGPALFAATHAAATVVAEAAAVLAVEFLPFLPIASIADARAMIAGAEARGSGLVVDTWHFVHGPDDWPALESIGAAEIAYVQFDDHPPLASADLLAETTQRRVLPGRGVFPLERFAATIASTGFDGLVGLEHLSAADRARPVEDVAVELVRAARTYWRGQVREV
jgi:sugar phosphate isomerase/epimerase